MSSHTDDAELVRAIQIALALGRTRKASIMRAIKQQVKLAKQMEAATKTLRASVLQEKSLEAARIKDVLERIDILEKRYEEKRELLNALFRSVRAQA